MFLDEAPTPQELNLFNFSGFGWLEPMKLLLLIAAWLILLLVT